MPAARRVEGVVAMAWTGRIDLRAGGIRRAAAGRRFVACAGNEVKRQRSGARRLRRRVCAARALRRGGGRRAAQILAAVDFGAIHSAAGPLARKKARNRVALYLKGARDGLCCPAGYLCGNAGRDKREARRSCGTLVKKTIWLADAKPGQDRHHTSRGRTKGPRDPSRPKSGWSTATPVDRTTKG